MQDRSGEFQRDSDAPRYPALNGFRPQKRVVSGFSHGNIENIIRTDPELVITFSDVQARLAQSVIKAGIPVLALNHFTAAGVADAIRLVGRVLGREETGETLASWCGKPVDIDSMRNREGFSSIDAVQTGQIHELPPEMILQAGPKIG